VCSGNASAETSEPHVNQISCLATSVGRYWPSIVLGVLMKQVKLQILLVLADQWRQSLKKSNSVIIAENVNAIRYFLKTNAKEFGLKDDFEVEFDNLMGKVTVKQEGSSMGWMNL
jgi:hypothetical protein